MGALLLTPHLLPLGTDAMYRKKPSGETVYSTPVVYFAEYNKRRLSTARCIIALTQARMSEGDDVGLQRALYVNNRIALRYTKKGYYSRTIKRLRSEIAYMKK